MGNSQLYHDLKKLMLQEIPIISQVVLTGTVNYVKNLRAVVAKIVGQICAKIGGIPWVVDEMPYCNKKTMVCGLNIYHES